MLDLVDKDIKAFIINMFKKLKENVQIIKGNMVLMIEDIRNLSKEI